jgi:hypothetical protein
MKLTKEQMKEAVMRIYGMLCVGDEEADILDEMGISAEQYENLKDKLFESKAQEFKTKPIEYTYIQYIIDQTHNLSILDEFIKSNKDGKGKSAQSIVGAIRARSEILDKIIARGQEFGIIKKVANRSEVVAGVLIAELSNTQLKKEITTSLDSLNLLLKKYGDKDIIDVSPGSIRSGRELPEAVLKTEEKSSEGEIIVKRIKKGSKKGLKRRDKARLNRRVVRKKE